MGHQELLASVLATRANQAKRLEDRVAVANRLHGSLAALTSTLSQAATDQASPQGLALRRQVQSALALVDQELAACAQVTTRLRRPHLTIGVVGRARTGKSRLLQSLTGLGPDVIPDGAGGFCTGVTSVIRPATEFTATVHFKTEPELQGQLASYYSRLSLTPPPSLTSARVPGDGELSELSSEDRELLRHLRDYVSALSEIQPHLGKGHVRVAREDVRTWVTQTDAHDRPQHGHRAVQRLEVTAPFGHGLESLSVVDLPGLGDTNLDDAERLLAALQDEVDVVLLVRRPQALGDDWNQQDIELYDLVARSLPDVDMRDRSFLVLNELHGEENAAQCRLFADRAASRSLHTASTGIVDASSPEQVSRLFDVVLEHLLIAAPRMDEALVSGALQRLQSLEEVTEPVLVAGLGWVGSMAEASPRHAREFIRLRNEAMRDGLYGGFEKLMRDLAYRREDPDERLHDAASEVIQRAREDKGLPDRDRFQVRVDSCGARSIAYGQLLNEARAHLAGHLVGLEPAVDASLELLKGRVLDVLESGGLAFLLDRMNPAPLNSLADELEPVLGPDSVVREALVTLGNARLSYRGFLQHRLRPLLDGLDADAPTHAMQGGQDYSTEDVLDMLEATYDEALGRIEVYFRSDVSAEPNRAVFALGEEFVDRVLRSRTADDEWQAVYQHYKDRVWPEQWARLAGDRAEVLEVQQHLDELRAHAQLLSSRKES